MHLTSISLKNFGIIQDFSHTFTDGFLVLSGENGMGKSTVLKALTMLIFDSYEGTLEAYQNWKADFFEIEVAFTHMSHSYRTTLRYDGQSTRFLYIDEGKNPYKGQDALAKLKEIFDPKQAMSSMISFQGENDLVNTSPSERRALLQKLFSLEFKEEIEKLDLELIENSEKKTKVQIDLSAIERMDFSPRPIPELPMTASEKAEVETAITDFKHSISVLKEGAGVIHELIGKKADLLKKIQHDTLKVQTIREEIEQAKREHANWSTVTLSQENEAIRWAEEQKAKGYPEAETIEKLMAEAAAITFPRLGVIDPLVGALDILRQERSGKVALFAEAKAHLEEATSLTGCLCPTCGGEIDDYTVAALHEKVENLHKEIENLDFQMAPLAEKVKAHQDAKELIEKRKSQKNLLEMKIQSLRLQEEKWANEMNTRITACVNARDKTLEKKENTLKLAEMKIFSGENELAPWEASVQNLKEELGKIEEKLSTHVDPSDKIMALEKTISFYETKIAFYHTTLGSIAAVKQENQKREEEKKEAEVRAEKLRREVQVLSERQALLLEAKKIFQKEFPVFVISYLIEGLERDANQFLSKTYGGRYEIRIKESRDALKVVFGPKEQDVKLASGYEKQVFSMAYKYAYSRLLGNRILILDEVDSFASEKNSETFYETLGGLQNFFDQIIVITHKQPTKNLLEIEYGARILEFDQGEVVSS